MQNPTITVRLLAKEAAKYIHSKAFVLAFLMKLDRYPLFSFVKIFVLAQSDVFPRCFSFLTPQ